MFVDKLLIKAIKTREKHNFGAHTWFYKAQNPTPFYTCPIPCSPNRKESTPKKNLNQNPQRERRTL